MNINDLESKIHQYENEKIPLLHFNLENFQTNYKTLYKKYQKLKKFVQEKKRSESTHPTSLSMCNSSNINVSSMTHHDENTTSPSNEPR